MPIYEYECSRCATVHEIWQKMRDAPISECPDCRGPVQKLISPTAFHLKGTGWYATDYKSPPKANGKDEAQTSTEGSEASGDQAKAKSDADGGGPSSTKEQTSSSSKDRSESS